MKSSEESCRFCGIETTHRFTTYSFVNKRNENTARHAYRMGGGTEERIEAGDFPCCSKDEEKTRAEILEVRNQLEGNTGWNLARITNKRKR